MSVEMIESFDGVELAVHRVGQGRPVLLLHGLFSSAEMNWIKFGHAQTLADAGFEAIMPDLRVHGASGKPHDPAAYPDDVLVRDAIALAGALQLEDFDLVGFSMGGRTAAGCVIAGMQPRRLVLSGMGLESVDNWKARTGFFIDAIDRFDEIKRGEPAFLAVSFMKTMGIDRVAARLLLETDMEMQRADLAKLTMPTAVICGDEDRDNGSPQALADALPDGTHIEIPGTHMSCVTKPDLGRAIASFLSD